MRRILLVLAAAALMVAMMVASAGPAMAKNLENRDPTQKGGLPLGNFGGTFLDPNEKAGTVFHCDNRFTGGEGTVKEHPDGRFTGGGTCGQ